MTGERLCVEEYALEWYSNNGGWNGIHSEVNFRVELASHTLSYSSHQIASYFFRKTLIILKYFLINSISPQGVCVERIIRYFDV